MKISAFAFLLTALVGLKSVPAQAALTHRYSFNDGDAKDSIGNAHGKLVGPGANISEGKLVLKNDPAGNPGSVSFLEFVESPLPRQGSVSLVAWFTVKEIEPFARIFDFGVSDGSEGRQLIYFSPRTVDDTARAAITATGIDAKTNVDFSVMDDGVPHMIAVIVDGAAKKLHVFADGREAAKAEDLGGNTLDQINPRNSWLGRSLFEGNPLLNGSIDEFRVYDHALSAEEITTTYKNGPNFLSPVPTSRKLPVSAQ